ncbi:MAG: hypothetical protein IPJ65_12555 [Archangiaceae bacterium]|nr:hypothetical protein [Archangiaceae bacterium]
MPRIKGSFFVIARPEQKAYEYVIVNEGDVPLTATHNVQRARGQGGVDSDDYGNFGHGMRVSPGKASRQLFPHQQLYKGGTPIDEGSIFRAGIRDHLYQEIPLPAMREGEFVRIEFDGDAPNDEVVWYGAKQGDAYQMEAAANHTASYRVASNHVDADDSANALAELDEMLYGIAQEGPKVAGEATVTPCFNPAGALTHWEVSFENQGKKKNEEGAFIGTVAFAAAEGKNAGLGLESMPCPETGSKAVQRIEANGNYGVAAVPGATLRLGVRGLSSYEVQLPDREPTVVPLRSFRRGAAATQDDWFDLEEVKKKRQEKMNAVQFFVKGKPLNAELKPITYRGAEALAESDYTPPSIKVQHLAEGPGGVPGWKVSVTNHLVAAFPPDFERTFPPDFVDEDLRDQSLASQPMGFVATLRLGEGGINKEQMYTKAFKQPGEERTWFIPEGMVATAADGRETPAAAGQTLTVGTRGMGVYVRLELPEAGKEVEASRDQPDLYALRPDQVAHSHLTHVFFEDLRDVADPDFDAKADPEVDEPDAD